MAVPEQSERGGGGPEEGAAQTPGGRHIRRHHQGDQGPAGAGERARSQVRLKDILKGHVLFSRQYGVMNKNVPIIRQVVGKKKFFHHKMLYF